MPDPVLRVDGLAELARTLRRFGDAELPKALKVAAKDAAQIVATEAATRVPVRSGALKRSIRAAGQAKGAVVRAGGARVPYAGWIEFGGTVRFRHKRGGITRPFVKDGRYIRPSARDKEQQVLATFEHGIQKTIRQIR